MRIPSIEAKAKYYEAHYASLANQIPNAMFVLDVEADRIVEVNKSAHELLGYTEEDLRTAVRIIDVLPDLQRFVEEVYRIESAPQRLSCVTASGRCLPV